MSMNLVAFDDAVDACAEVEIDMLPGDAIRHQNDLIVDLLDALEGLTAGTGSSPGANKKYAKARAAIAKARGEE